MNYVSIGDMAQTYLLRRHNTQLKTTMTRLTEELTSGIQRDLGVAVKGDFTALAALNRSLVRLGSLSQSASETELFTSTQQDALELVQGHADDIGASMISAASTSESTTIVSINGDAAQRFESIIGALNVSVAGRHVFSGTATDTAPLASADVIVAALSSAVSGLTSASDIAAAVNDWFDAPAGGGGFLDTAYLGNTDTLAPVQISETDQANLELTAMDPSVRDMLKGFALATLISEDQVPASLELRSALTRTAGEQIVTASAALTTKRAELGTVQGIVSDAQVRNTAEKSSLEISRTKLIGIDEYDSATALDAVQTQLETLYTLTARLSSLSLTDYL